MKEKGLCSVSVIMLAAMIAVMGGFFLLFAKAELTTANALCEGIAAEHFARAGICRVLVNLNKKKDEDITLRKAGELVCREQAGENGGRYTVYMTHSTEGIIVLLSIGEFGEAKRQIIVTLDVTENKDVWLAHWVNQ